ncbi:hypothetical protein [Bacillus phage SPO1L5]|nr:hypothetical protein Goe9_c01200 [Bacillus phage vB_BsuM-Goe9]QMV48647.1 hypothetical protein Goe10_c01190 [Bacillus phage vB_BsuM-Goe10]WIT26648.1 hypothetical protein [Bacillus phage SPO1L5]
MANKNKNLTEEERKKRKEQQYMNKVVTRGEVATLVNGAMKSLVEGQNNLWEQQRLLYIQIQCVIELLKGKGVISDEQLEEMAKKVIKDTAGVAEELLEGVEEATKDKSE